MFIIIDIEQSHLLLQAIDKLVESKQLTVEQAEDIDSVRRQIILAQGVVNA